MNLPATLATFFISIVLFGCAGGPPAPRIETAVGERIGFLVEGGESPTHTHIGTTVFNNFTKKYPYRWNLESQVAGTIGKSIAEAGYTPVDLKAAGLRLADVDRLIQPKEFAWVVTPGREPALKRLRDQFGLKAVIVLKEGPVTTSLECAGGPCSARSSGGSGLFTRSFFGLTRYHGVAAYHWNVFVLDPPVDTARATELFDHLRYPARIISDYADPANFENLTESEFGPVRETILKMIRSFSILALRSLNNASDIANQPQ